ncbi:mCG1040897 [Mus musculus]|nr:mCG1040897 [Mus musculus]
MHDIHAGLRGRLPLDIGFSWSTLPPTREKMPKTHPSKSHCSKSVTDKKISHSANFSS